MASVMKYRMTGFTKWNIIAMPSPSWAKSVFPELDEKKGYRKALGKYLCCYSCRSKRSSKGLGRT